MKQLNTFLKLIILLAIVGLVVYSMFFWKPAPVIEYKYVTDTIHDSIPYEVSVPFRIETPPSVIVEYVIDSTALDEYKLIIHSQNILIKKLADSLFIHSNFIKAYPSNPKIVGIGLYRDTLQMGLLEIAGVFREYTWPIDLNRYNYRWDLNNGFTRKRLKPTALPPTEKAPFANYYVGGAVDIMQSNFMLTGRIEKSIASARLYTSLQFGLLDITESNFQIGVEYNINGKKHY